MTVSHLPPGTSKWNKIEHRLFSQITHYRHGRSRGRMHERSRFERRGRRWMYVDGEQHA